MLRQDTELYVYDQRHERVVRWHLVEGLTAADRRINVYQDDELLDILLDEKVHGTRRYQFDHFKVREVLYPPRVMCCHIITA